MPKPSQRTRSRRRNLLKLPGSRVTVHYNREKIGAPLCARCGRPLLGVPRLTSSKLRNLNASRRRIQRIYGGQLCHTCLQEGLKQTVRSGALA